MDAYAAESGDKMNGEEVPLTGNGKVIDEANCECPLLTKEDLLRIDREEPIWRRVRIALIALFWVVWFSLVIASTLYIVFAPKCAPRPTHQFWQSKVAYWVNPFAFSDSNNDSVGDLRGLESAGDYIINDVGAGFIILTSMSPLYPHIPNNGNVSFRHIHPALGSMSNFSALLRGFKKKGVQVVITLNFNSVPINHELAKPDFLLDYGTENKFCVSNVSGAVPLGTQLFYSTYGNDSKIVDLNLTSVNVLDEIKKATLFWLSMGVDGILLSDVAFFAKNKGGSGCFSCEPYASETISVIQHVRGVVDEVSASTSRPRVLIVDPGNTGCSAILQNDELLLGPEDAPGAHLVVSRAFTFNKLSQNAVGEAALKAYLQSANNSLHSQLALTVASPSDRPYSSIFSTASVLLLPGTPVIYAGSELGSPKKISRNQTYPFGQLPAFGDAESHFPMPWYSNVVDKDFSHDSFQHDDTVKTALAAGRGHSIFNLTTSLVLLHKEHPSLLWGSLNSTLGLAKARSITVFKRSADGFDSIIVVLVKANSMSSAVDFSSECSTLAPLIVYPPNELFKNGVQLPSLVVYLKSQVESALYVFKCTA